MADIIIAIPINVVGTDKCNIDRGGGEWWTNSVGTDNGDDDTAGPTFEITGANGGTSSVGILGDP